MGRRSIIMNIKEIIMASTAVVGLGLGVMNLVGNRKNKKNISALEQKILVMNTPRTNNEWYNGNSPFQNQPQPVAPTE